MFDNKFASFEDDIQKYIESKLTTLENTLEKVEMKLQEIENKIHEKKQSTP